MFWRFDEECNRDSDSGTFHSPYMPMQLTKVRCQKYEKVKKMQTIRRQLLKRLKRTLRPKRPRGCCQQKS